MGGGRVGATLLGVSFFSLVSTLDLLFSLLYSITCNPIQTTTGRLTAYFEIQTKKQGVLGMQNDKHAMPYPRGWRGSRAQ